MRSKWAAGKAVRAGLALEGASRWEERPISANLSGAALTNALRCRRTVSVCAVVRRAKRGRFAYFALKLALMGERPKSAGLQKWGGMGASLAP